ncbi:MAG: MFS transporter [Alphaproteobacteria bacterium]
MAKLIDFSSISRALGERNYRIYTSGAAVSLLGLWVQRIAVGWLTWELTRSGTWLGLIAFADLFPTVVLTPIAGVIADRMDRRHMSIIAQSLAMVQAVLLSGLTIGGLIDIRALFGLTLFLGVVTSFGTAARLSLIPNLVSREHLSSAIAINSAVFNIARFLGPAVGGVIIVASGVGPAFAFNAATFVVFLVALSRVRVLSTETAGKSEDGVMSQVVEALRYARTHPGIGPMLLLLIATALGGKAYMELLPGFADDVFGRGAEALAQFTAAAGLGALVTALWLAQRGVVVGLTLITISSVLVGGLTILLFTASDIFWVALPCTLVAGAAMAVTGTGTQTLMQNTVAGAMRGRVMSLYGVIFRGAPALGALIMGALSEIIGLRLAVAGGGVLCLLVWFWAMKREPITARALEGDLADKPGPGAPVAEPTAPSAEILGKPPSASR